MADVMDGAAVACKNVILHEKFKKHPQKYSQ